MDRQNLQNRIGNRRLLFLKQTGSTNTDARDWVQDDPTIESGSVVVADDQTQGRGRFNRKWETQPGAAIAMSVILRDRGDVALPIVAGLAVRDAVQSVTEQMVDLKWPNDVLIDEKKVAGILVEAVSSPSGTAYIVGIGINVRNQFAGTELESTATNVQTYANSYVDRESLIAVVLSALDRWIERDDVLMKWESALVTIGEYVTLASGDETIEGRAVDVDSNGAIGIEDGSGEVAYYPAGDVTIVKKQA